MYGRFVIRNTITESKRIYETLGPNHNSSKGIMVDLMYVYGRFDVCVYCMIFASNFSYSYASYVNF